MLTMPLGFDKSVSSEEKNAVIDKYNAKIINAMIANFIFLVWCSKCKKIKPSKTITPIAISVVIIFLRSF